MAFELAKSPSSSLSLDWISLSLLFPVLTEFWRVCLSFWRSVLRAWRFETFKYYVEIVLEFRGFRSIGLVLLGGQ